MMLRGVLLVAITFSAACAGRYYAPAVPQPRQPAVVSASFDRTWNAVIDVFAQQVIAIETMERASGFIVASTAVIPQRLKADSVAALALADCGRTYDPLRQTTFVYLPTGAKYNVVVRQASAATTTVQVTTKFLGRGAANAVTECTSKGVFEDRFESLVKARAEQTIGQ